jgi:two-component system chemotaxis sensor kinase CheA
MGKDPYKYFRVEARELVQGLAQGVLQLERAGVTRELVASLLRFAHTLKGAARVVKLTALASQAHALEDALTPYREGDGPVPEDRLQALLRLVDEMAAAVSAIEPAQSSSAGDAQAPADAGAPRATREPLDSVRVDIEEMDQLLEGVVEAAVQMSSFGRDTEAIDRAVQLAGILVAQLAPRRTGEAPGPTAAAHAAASELRATVERLRGRLSRSVDLVSRELAEVRDAANRLRLLPASAIFSPLERAARDAAYVLGKRVTFKASGGELRIDAHVLGGVRDALLHIVRNAVAHGLEAEDARRAKGKAPVGRVELDVRRAGADVVFTCTDDGQGIDVEALRRQALRTGRARSAAEASAMGRQELLDLLLRGDLTTTGVAVDEVSGRGIGLDVVRENVRRLHGSAIARSEAGRGTTVEIRVPVSLSSLTGLMVDAGGISAVVPLDAVRRTLRLAASDIARAPGGDSIVYEGKVIPFVPLARTLRRPAGPDRRRWSTVVVEAEPGLAAVGVDRLRGTANVVVRSLPETLGVSSVVAGASLDVEGNPELVLDPCGVVRDAQAEPGAAPARVAERRPVLVVDDSLTTRMLEQSILESAGYEVHLATCAEEALVKARERRFGVFVVDVEMPGMDGFAFVSLTRADPVLRETPAILVTSRGSAEDKKRGLEAGARAYVVKGEFDQSQLLRIVRELVE